MIEKKETKEKNWVTTDSRFVVFLDIMGFKDFVARNTHQHVYEMMTKLSTSKEIVDTFLENNPDDKYKSRALYTTSFSDSLILFSKDDSPISLEIIEASTSFLVSEAMMCSIPMKGAIAHGIISVNKKQQIYFGQPLIDAYLLQEEVNYYGVVLHNSVDSYLNKMQVDPDTNIKQQFIEIKTPLKTGSIMHNNINWFKTLRESTEDKSKIKEKFENIITELKTITSGAPRKYIDNTIDVFNIMNK